MYLIKVMIERNVKIMQKVHKKEEDDDIEMVINMTK